MVLAVTGQAAAGSASGLYTNFATGKVGGYYAWSDNCQPIYNCIVPEGPNRVVVTDYSDGYHTKFKLSAAGSGSVYYTYVDTLVTNNTRMVRYVSTMPVGPIKFEFCPVNFSGVRVGGCQVTYRYNS